MRSSKRDHRQFDGGDDTSHSRKPFVAYADDFHRIAAARRSGQMHDIMQAELAHIAGPAKGGSLRRSVAT